MYLIAYAVVLASIVFVRFSNPVYGVLSLVAVSAGLASLLLGLGAEFIAFIIVLVYVGAVTVLFLFVVMMINLRVTTSLITGLERWLLWFVNSVNIFNISRGWYFESYFSNNLSSFEIETFSGLFHFGAGLYSTEKLSFPVVVGTLLFVSMVSAICLTLMISENYRTQDIYTQIRRSEVVFGFSHLPLAPRV